MGAAVAVPGVLGAIGLLSANQASQDQANAQRKALQASKDANAPVSAALRAMLGLAQNYDPSKDTDVAVNRAKDVAGYTLGNVLRNLNGEYLSGGQTPGNSSEYFANQFASANRVLDPLKEFVATQKANEFQRKMAAYAAVNGGNTGNLSSAYFQNAQSFNPSYGPSLGLLSQAINGMKFGAPGAGGLGDSRQASAPGSQLGSIFGNLFDNQPTVNMRDLGYPS